MLTQVMYAQELILDDDPVPGCSSVGRQLVLVTFAPLTFLVCVVGLSRASFAESNCLAAMAVDYLDCLLPHRAQLATQRFGVVELWQRIDGLVLARFNATD
jgi:hypothetical protein